MYRYMRNDHHDICDRWERLCATVVHVNVTLPVLTTFMLSVMNCSTVHGGARINV